jgi:hypothetical protein
MNLISGYLQFSKLVRNICVFIPLMLLVSGCATAKLMSKENPLNRLHPNTLQVCQANNLEFQFLTANTMEIVFSQQGKEYRSEAVMKIIKDTAMQVSVLPVMGVEAFRFLLDKDSLLVIDRFNRKAYISDFNEVTGMLGNYFKLGSIQDLLAGNLPAPHQNDSILLINTLKELDSYRIFNNDFNSKGSVYLESLIYTVKTNIGKLSKVEVISSKGKIEIDYSGFTKYKKKQVPSLIHISLFAQNGIKTIINLKYGDFKDKASIKGGAHVPKGYKAINWSVL